MLKPFSGQMKMPSWKVLAIFHVDVIKLFQSMPHSMALTLTLLFSVPVMVTSTRVEWLAKIPFFGLLPHPPCWIVTYKRSLTTKGLFEIEVLPEWAPLGAQRYLDLVTDGFYTDIPMYRSVAGFLTQVISNMLVSWYGDVRVNGDGAQKSSV